MDGIAVVELLSDYQWLDHDLDISPAWTTGDFNMLFVTVRVMLRKVSRALSSEFR